MIDDEAELFDTPVVVSIKVLVVVVMMPSLLPSLLLLLIAGNKLLEEDKFD